MLYSFKWNVIEYSKLGEKICSSSPGPEDHVKYCELCHHFLSSMIISGNSAIISWHLLVWSPGVQTLVSGYIGFQSFGVQTMVSESRVHTSLVSGLTSSKGRITNIGIRPFRVYELQSLELKHLFQDLCVPRLWCNILALRVSGLHGLGYTLISVSMGSKPWAPKVYTIVIGEN